MLNLSVEYHRKIYRRLDCLHQNREYIFQDDDAAILLMHFPTLLRFLIVKYFINYKKIHIFLHVLK